MLRNMETGNCSFKSPFYHQMLFLNFKGFIFR